MKKLALLLVIVMILGCALPFSSCNKSDTPPSNNDNVTSEPPEPTKTKQEIELENALRLEREGAWAGAYFLLDDLIERGYYTEYAEKREDLYYKYIIADHINAAINYNGLKTQLKNPNSLVIYNITITASVSQYSSDSYVFELEFEYGATNSLGAMVRDTYETKKNSSLAQKYIGQTVDCSFVNLSDVAKMTHNEFDQKLQGDFKLYHHNLRNDVTGNIWKE